MSYRRQSSNEEHNTLPRLPDQYIGFANKILVAADWLAAHGTIDLVDKQIIASVCAMLEQPLYVTGSYTASNVKWFRPRIDQEQINNLTVLSFDGFCDWFWKRLRENGISQKTFSEITTELSKQANEIAEWESAGCRSASLKGMVARIGKDMPKIKSVDDSRP